MSLLFRTDSSDKVIDGGRVIGRIIEFAECEDIWSALDSDSADMEALAPIFNIRTENYFSAEAGRIIFPDAELDEYYMPEHSRLLIIESMYFEPQMRKIGLGSAALRDLIDCFGSEFDALAINVIPEYREQDQKNRSQGDRVLQKLIHHFEGLGFKSLPSHRPLMLAKPNWL